MGKKYLLDSNICVYLLRNERGISDYLRKVKRENCCILPLKKDYGRKGI